MKYLSSLSIIALYILCTGIIFAGENVLDTTDVLLPGDHIIIGHATNLPPYSFLDEDGRGVGYSLDLSREIVRVMQLDAEFRIGPWGELRDAMENGEIQALVMFYSIERDELLDFSSRFAIVYNAIFVRQDTPAIHSEEDLFGKDIIVIRGDIMHDYVLANGISDNPVLASTESEALRLLALGSHDLALMAQLPGLYWVRELNLPNIVTTGPLLRPSDIAYAVGKGDLLLQQQFSEGLAVLNQTGVLRQIRDRWLGVLEPPVLTTAEVLKYIVFAAAPFLLILILILLWSRTLRRQVNIRTKELHDSQAVLSHHIQNTPLGCISWDREFKCTEWNSAAEQIFEYSTDEAIGQLAIELIIPTKNREDIGALYELLLTQTSGTKTTNENITKDGKSIICNWYNTPIADDNGKVTGVASLVLDVTESKHAEEALKQNEERFRSISTSSSVSMIIAVDEAGMIISWNPAAERQFMYSEEEMLGCPITNIMPERYRTSHKMGFQRAAKSDKYTIKGTTTEYYGLKKNGDEFPIEVSLGTWNQGEKKYFSAIINDITERKEYKEDLERQTHDLDKRVKEQTCLYAISEIFSRMDITVKEAMEMVVKAIPHGWQYPEITCARITLEGDSFSSENFKKSAWGLSSDIVSGGKATGSAEVYYLEERPELEAGPFLLEEQYLINSIGTIIETFLARKVAEDARIRAQSALAKASTGTISAIAATVEKRDPYTSGHQKKVALLAVKIATELDWDEFRIEGLRLGASIHDIGKIYVPAEILSRPGKLSAPEFDLIKSHPSVGADILKDTEFPWPIQKMLEQHHERIDGSGYPNGLKGDQIIEEAKVIAVADVVEAMSAHRPYRAALGIESAVEELERGKGTAYDSAIVDICIKVVMDKGFDW